MAARPPRLAAIRLSTAPSRIARNGLPSHPYNPPPPHVWRSLSHGRAGAAGLAAAVVTIALAIAAASAPPGHEGGEPWQRQQAPSAAHQGGGPPAEAASPWRLPTLLPEAHANHAPACASVSLLVGGSPRPAISSIRFTSPNATYFVGESIGIRVTADSGIHPQHGTVVSHTRLVLDTGAGVDRFASYASQNLAAGQANYEYTVVAGDLSGDLDYKATNSLYWRHYQYGSNNVQTPSGVDYNCALPEPRTAGSLSAQGDVAVVGIARPDAHVRGVTPGGAYGAGSMITVAAVFKGPAAYSGDAPTLALNVSGSKRYAAFWEGNDTARFLFNYTVRDGDNAAVVGYYGPDSLQGAIVNRTGHLVNLTLPAIDTLALAGGIELDSAPTVASVSSPNASRTYGIGRTIHVNVTFTEAVEVDTASGSPALLLGTGAAGRNATYVPGLSAGASLLFEYAVGPGDFSPNLDYASRSALSLNGSTIEDGTGNAAILALPDPGGDGLLAGGAALVIDGVRPEVASVSSPNASMAYSAGDSITVGVTFDDTVEVDTARGTPTIMLETGRPGSHATYQSGSGSPTLLFRYIVAPVDESDDLDYSSESALVLNGGTIRDGVGNDADLGLPPPGSDGLLPPGRGAIEVVHAAPPLIPQDSADTGDDGYLLGAARAVDAFGINGRAYAVVAASGNNTVQLIRVHENGTLSPAGQAIDLPNRSLATTEAVDAFRIGGDTFAIAASMGEGVQLIRVNGSDGTLVPEGRLSDNASLRLMTANDVAAFGMGGDTYALVAALYDDGDSDPNDGGGGLQLVRVRGDATLEANSSMAVSDGDPGFERLETPYNVAAFSMGGDTYALVTSTHGDEGVQLVRVRGDATLEAAGNATDGNGGFEALNGTRGVDVFRMGNATYAMVAAETDDAVQLIRVRADGALEAVSSAFNGTRGFDALDGAHGVSVFNGTDGGLYAIVASRGGDAVQLIHIRSDGTLLPAGSAAEGAGNPTGPAVFDELDGASSVAAFGLGGRSYAAVASHADNGVQLIRMSPAAATGAATSAANGTYWLGEEIAIEVAFHDRVNVTGQPELRLNSRGTAEYQSGNDSRTLVFSYEVGPGDRADSLDYDGRFALYGPGEIVEAETGVAANRTLPAPGSPGSLSGSASISVVGSAPTAATADAAFTGPNTIRIEYSAPLGPPAGHAGPVYGAITAEGGATATPEGGGVSGLGTAVHTVRFGGGGVNAGQSGTISLGVALEGREGAAWHAFPAGAIPVRAGEDARTLAPAGISPVVSIESNGFVRAVNATGAGDAARPAIDVSGLSASSLSADASRNTVRFPAEAVSLAASFAEVTIPPNATAMSIPADGLLELYISAQWPTAQQVAKALGASAAGVYVLRVVEVGDNATHITFSLPVRILLAGQANGTAFYVNNTDRTVVPIRAECSADNTTAVRVQLAGAGECQLDSGADKVIHTYHLTLFGTAMAPGGGPVSGSTAIEIDEIAPRVAGVASATPDGAYGDGERIVVAVRFTEPVLYSGSAPELLLNVSGAPAPAPYASGNGTDTLRFAYTVRAGDASDDLAYWNTTALSGSIADAAGNAADLALPEPGSSGSLSGSASISVVGSAPAAATADAAFTGPNTIRIEYSAPLGPPAGHAGPVYGTITIGDNTRVAPETGGVSGLGTAVHTVRFNEGSAESNQNGTIVLSTDLKGEAGGISYSFAAGSIPVRAGADARTLAPAGISPVVAIESDGFVRAVNATGAGDAARPAIDVSGLSNATLSADASRNTVRFPAEAVSLAASFAEVVIPPNATAMSIPADGRLDLYVSAQGPTARQVAKALGASAAAVGSLMVVEVGDNATHITFSLPVRILLVGQANGTAFYVNNTDRTVVPIRAECAVDGTDAVHKRLNGTGIDECWLDSGADKVIYTYHLTLFGTAMAPGGGPPFVPVCGISLGPQRQQPPPPIEFGGVREGGQSLAMDQEIENAGTLPIDTVTIRAAAWTDASGSEAMPASATSVMAGARGWVALNGEVAVPWNAEGATAKFRVDVPAGALPEDAPAAGVAASQTITYTAACGPPPG